MNEVLALLRSRRSVPANLLVEPGPSPDELGEILTVASRVPDHGKLAPWRFLIIEGEARGRAGELIAAAFSADEPSASAEKVSLERNRLARAPVVIAVVSRARPHVKIPEWEQTLSAGAVCMNLVVAANGLGFGTAWLTEWYAYDRRVLDGLGLEPDESVAGFIHVGTAREPIADRPRPALADIVARF